MAADELGGGLDGEAGAEVEGALVEWGGEGIVNGEYGAGLPWRGADAVEVCDVEERVGGGFEPEEVGGACGFDPEGGVTEGDALDGPSFAGLTDFCKVDDTLVAVVWQGDGGTGGELIEDGGDGGHSGGEGERGGVFEAAEDLFECIPTGGGVSAGVDASAAEHEVGGGCEGGVERLAGLVGATCGHKPGVDGEGKTRIAIAGVCHGEILVDGSGREAMFQKDA